MSCLTASLINLWSAVFIWRGAARSGKARSVELHIIADMTPSPARSPAFLDLLGAEAVGGHDRYLADVAYLWIVGSQMPGQILACSTLIKLDQLLPRKHI